MPIWFFWLIRKKIVTIYCVINCHDFFKFKYSLFTLCFVIMWSIVMVIVTSMSQRLDMLYKIVNKTSPLYLHSLITIKQSKYSFRYQNTASIPSTRTTRYGIKTFEYFAAKIWNELPNHFRLKNSFKQFKNLINSWNGSSCHCNACKL